MVKKVGNNGATVRKGGVTGRKVLKGIKTARVLSIWWYHDLYDGKRPVFPLWRSWQTMNREDHN